jgi:hypothetical protein
MISTNRRKFVRLACVLGLSAAGAMVLAAEKGGPPQPWSPYLVNDPARPAPPIITPGTVSTQDAPGKPPSDAIVLFDGKDMSQWQAQGGGDPTFRLEDGAMLSYGPKYCETKRKFGDVQVHVEWSEPTPPKGSSQGRGNSGVFMMGLFETQVLDNYDNPTYADGLCGAVYGQYPPEVNACLPPGQWQTYDIIFRHPRYKDGALVEPAYVTVLQNGVLIQDHQRIEGPTQHMVVAHYPDSMPDEGPIDLQYHNNIVRFRNIWARPLEALEVQQQTGKVADAGADQK